MTLVTRTITGPKVDIYGNEVNPLITIITEDNGDGKTIEAITSTNVKGELVIDTAGAVYAKNNYADYVVEPVTENLQVSLDATITNIDDPGAKSQPVTTFNPFNSLSNNPSD